MEEQLRGVEEIRAHISERYPMYVANPGFEQWLLRRAGTDVAKIGDYLTLLDDYGYITGDGTLANDYQNVPAPEGVTEDVERRLASLSPESRALLGRAAVQGPHFSLELADAIAGSGGGEGSLEEAIAAGLVLRDEHPDASAPSLSHRYRFVPQQAAKIVYEALPDEARTRYHAALVEFLSDELGTVADLGAQDMLARMINEHNRRSALPDPSPSKD